MFHGFNMFQHVQHVSTRLRSPFWRFDLICIGGRGMAFGTTGGGTTTGRGGGTTTGRGLGLGDLGGDGGRISWCSACAAHPTVSHRVPPGCTTFSIVFSFQYFALFRFQHLSKWFSSTPPQPKSRGSAIGDTVL
jgi:hypothetical protein